MSKRQEPNILVLCPIPADLRNAFTARFPLVEKAEITGWPGKPASGFRVALTTSMHGIDSATMEALPDLKLVLCQGTGLDRIDLATARARGIAVAHTPDELAADVAEAAIALMFAIMRRIAEADRFVRAGRWPKERIAPSTRVSGKTMGIVGLGRIGRSIAQRAEGNGMTVIYAGRKPQLEVSYDFSANIIDLAEQSDVLMLSCPGGEATRHIVNRDVLKALGPNGYLINVARGSVVDEAALIEALQNGTIAGAGLDVFENEPNIDPRFFTLENAVIEPHSSSITHETRQAIMDRLLGDLDAFLAGRQFFDAAKAR